MKCKIYARYSVEIHPLIVWTRKGWLVDKRKSLLIRKNLLINFVDYVDNSFIMWIDFMLSLQHNLQIKR